MNYVPFKIAKSFKEVLNDKSNTLYELFIIPSKGYKVKRILCTCLINKDWGYKVLQIFIYNKLGNATTSYNNYYTVDVEDVNLDDDTISTNHWAGIFTLSRDKAYGVAMSNLKQMIRGLRTKEISIHKQIYIT